MVWWYYLNIFNQFVQYLPKYLNCHLLKYNFKKEVQRETKKKREYETFNLHTLAFKIRDVRIYRDGYQFV